MGASTFYVPPPVSLTCLSNGLELQPTLSCGQAFSWKLGPANRWYGWVNGLPCVVWSQGEELRATGPGLTFDSLTKYFNLDRNWDTIWHSFPESDPFLKRAREFAPGLRLLHQDPWETLCNFICSSQKQVVQIEQINRELRRVFGNEIQPGWQTFPKAEILANLSVESLRACKLGYRANLLLKTAKQIAKREVCLEKVAAMPTEQASLELQKLAGVGEKVASCVLLFAYDRMEAFPIDVWVDRILKRLYLPNQKKVLFVDMIQFAKEYFGPYRGFAQQILFHWARNFPDQLPKEPGAVKE
jgi:N-glycosylase/DNA lyase